MALKSQTQFDVLIQTTEMHTGGEPLRIIESGYPVPQGKTILDKINDLRENHDAYRKFLMFEPRGHYDMYGFLLVTPDHPDADIAVIFLHNEGYSTMCGHGVISLGRYAVDRGLIRRPITSPETAVNIQCPCGLVTAYVQVDAQNNNKTGRVRFESVPSFVVKTDVDLELPDVGKFQVDVVYGGAFYALVSVKDVGLVFGKSSNKEFTNMATKIKEEVNKVVKLSHPSTPAFLYGVIYADFRVDKVDDGPATQLIVFADAETDRSPCGSGSSGRIALMLHRGQVAMGQKQVFRSGVTGAEFTAKVVSEAGEVTGQKAVITEVSGHGYYSGTSSFALETEDDLGRGFLVR